MHVGSPLVRVGGRCEGDGTEPDLVGVGGVLVPPGAALPGGGLVDQQPVEPLLERGQVPLMELHR